jgi:hypothetical protein
MTLRRGEKFFAELDGLPEDEIKDAPRYRSETLEIARLAADGPPTAHLGTLGHPHLLVQRMRSSNSSVTSLDDGL